MALQHWKSRHYYIRKAHRWLGVILGIQFLLWTIGGLYFSWNDIDEIHGDLQRKKAPLLPGQLELVSPSQVLDSIAPRTHIDSILGIELLGILGKPYYLVRILGRNKADTHPLNSHTFLANAEDGTIRPPLTQEEAIRVAREQFIGEPEVSSVTLLDKAGAHHEYRGNVLPAYAISFSHPSHTTVYVSTERGTVQKFRNQKWRIFDFLWMMHTMDYEGRDDFGNTLLRVFSVMGLVTVLSGFLLFIVSSKYFK